MLRRAPVVSVFLLLLGLTLLSVRAYAQPLSATAVVTSNACGGTSGIITVQGKGGVFPYQYSIDGGANYQGGNAFNNLSAGTYTITIKDNLNNTATAAAVTLDNSCLKVIATPKGTVCGRLDGMITGQGTGGTGPYTYSLDGANFQTGISFSPLAAGDYILTVKDFNGLTASVAVTITDEPGPVITSVTKQDADCNGLGASLAVNTTGGAAPLAYSLDGTNFQTDYRFTAVPPGAYQVTVKDNNGCIANSSGQIDKICLQLLVHGTDPGCLNNDGTITAVVGNGFPPYQYSIDAINFQGTPDFTGLPAGDYRIYVVDDIGQSTSAAFKLTQVCLKATLTPGDPTCGQSNGTIEVAASGGYAPFHYSLDGTNFQDDPKFTGLAPQSYTVTIKDDKGDKTTAGITLTAVAAAIITATPTAATCANNDGVLTVSGLGGPQPYQFALDGGSYGVSGIFDHLTSGTHEVKLKDASGCEVKQNANVPLTNNLTANAGPDIPICEGRSGMIKAVSNGTTFTWTPAAGLSDPSVLQPTASPSVNTTYFLMVSAGPCQLAAPVSVNVIVKPAPVAAAAPVDPICFGLSTQLQGSGGSIYRWTPATYLSNPNISNPTVNKPAGTTTYRLTVTDINNCESLNPAVVTLRVIQPPPVYAGNDTSILAGQPLPLHAVDVSNSGLSGWQWTPSQWLDNAFSQDPLAHPQESITYTVTGATAKGCEGTASISVKVFTVSDIFVPNAFTPNGDGHNDQLKPVMVGIKELRYFAVFDRFGQRVFYTTTPGAGWRGDINGKIQPGGTYVWTAGGINYNGEFIQRKGTALLIR